MQDTTRAIALSAVIWAVGSVCLLSPGILLTALHYPDMLHLLAYVERLRLGELPHLDFATPLGLAGFYPIAGLMALGLPFAQAFLAAQVLLGLALGGLALAIALPRMPWYLATGFTVLVMINCLGLIHSGPINGLSVALHYNRWAWAIAFVVIVLSALPGPRERRWEAVILGALMAALLMIKATYFLALAPAVTLALLLQGRRQSLILALSTGAVIAGVLTLTLGVAFWGAYLSDLIAVTQSYRSAPFASFAELLVAAPNVLASATVLGLAVLLALRGRRVDGVILALMFAAGTYITSQNSENDPVHWGVLALVLAVWAVAADPENRLKAPLALGAVALFALSSSSLVNLAVSPVRHALFAQNASMPALIGAPSHQELRQPVNLANLIGIQTTFAEGYRTFGDTPPPGPLQFQGEDLPRCQAYGSPAYLASITTDLRERGLAQGASIFTVDIISPFWLLGDHQPLTGGSIWNYGALRGLESADFVLLPICPMNRSARQQIMQALAEEPLSQVIRTPLYILYERG